MNIMGLLIKLRAPSAARFDLATKEPLKAQEKVLFGILKKNANTLFGKMHGFSHIRTIEDYRKNVPVNDYESLRPFIRKMMRGEGNILLKDRPIFYGITSGTTSSPKFIPVTRRSRLEKARTMNLWVYHLLTKHPEALDGKALVIVSPAVEGHAESGIPYGSESGDAYRNIPPLIRSHYALPYEVFLIKDYEARYYTILRISMEKNVTDIATLNPLTLLVLCQKIPKYTGDIIRDIRDGTLKESFKIDDNIRRKIEKRLKPNPRRAAMLEKLLVVKGALIPKDFWPGLAVLECWTGGTVGMYIKEIAGYFPERLKMRDFGYVSTEARCSIPVSDDGPSGILTIGANFYEFIPEEEREKKDRTFLTADKLRKGGRYYVVFTTPSGLYRYDIDDIVRVAGFYNKTPVIEFIQKGKNVSSATGEKLYESQVISAIHNAREATGINVNFFCACLEYQIPPSYSFLVEFTAEPDLHQKRHFLNRIEDNLGRINMEYRTKRSSQRLGDPKLKVLEKGSFERFRQARLAVLQHDSQFKACHLRCDFKIPPEFKIIEEISL